MLSPKKFNQNQNVIKKKEYYRAKLKLCTLLYLLRFLCKLCLFEAAEGNAPPMDVARRWLVVPE